TPGFARIASRLAALALPSVIVQEGGYLSDALGPNLASFLNGFQ
ncbi:MAG: histone deacetylase family protein, partial [Gammaproteobacteria bacterium]|nr:histone deacetylase family protein [Gammaproteobacteria bacterium]